MRVHPISSVSMPARPAPSTVRQAVEDAPVLVTGGCGFHRHGQRLLQPADRADPHHRSGCGTNPPWPARCSRRSTSAPRSMHWPGSWSSAGRKFATVAAPSDIPTVDTPKPRRTNRLPRDWCGTGSFAALTPGNVVLADQGTCFYGMAAHRLPAGVTFIGQPSGRRSATRSRRARGLPPGPAAAGSC